MNTKLLLTIVLPAITFIAIVPLIPAFAVAVTFATHETDSPIGPFNVGVICGSNDNIFTGKTTYYLTFLDSGKGDLQIIDKGDLVDSVTGAHVGQVSFAGHENVNPGSQPQTFQENQVVTCNNSGPASTSTFHMSFTIDSQGNIHFHT